VKYYKTRNSVVLLKYRGVEVVEKVKEFCFYFFVNSNSEKLFYIHKCQNTLLTLSTNLC
jgi:hypothetical protein